MAEKKVLVNYNFLRILAIFLVVSTHVMGPVWLADEADSAAWHLREVIRNLTLTCNGLFFMLSGRFILERYDGRALRFYADRLVKIGIPAFFAAAFQFFYLYRSIAPEILVKFVRQFMGAEILGYLWFLFALACFYLAVPFLARMMQNLSTAEKRLLLLVSFAVFLVQDIYVIKSVPQRFTAYPFYSNLFYCVLGYLLDSIDLTRRETGALMGLGVLGFFLSAWEEFHIPGLNALLHDLAPSMILMTAALYLLVTRFGGVVTKHIEKAVNLLSRYIFLLYLLHGFAQNLLFGMILQKPQSGYGAWLLWSAVSFCIAFLMAVAAYHALYTPYLKWMRSHVIERIRI